MKKTKERKESKKKCNDKKNQFFLFFSLENRLKHSRCCFVLFRVYRDQ